MTDTTIAAMPCAVPGCDHPATAGDRCRAPAPDMLSLAPEDRCGDCGAHLLVDTDGCCPCCGAG
ncbi:hypothetical protein [Azospirillum picis]|uniref:Amidophosphoribosyltransferase n=1 Tax=Azospirillum picis TaxID=488438 RepID=A0ABU0MUI5_9PROT|nr:hypothetical protein [Azospirillum picis]MBP2303298.1 putative amidophosphoribosyltransferase [Azospirillum picis]MDQ0537162.1 putative amidophosphoribosyltransferase [Azospirillum picis]